MISETVNAILCVRNSHSHLIRSNFRWTETDVGDSVELAVGNSYAVDAHVEVVKIDKYASQISRYLASLSP